VRRGIVVAATLGLALAFCGAALAWIAPVAAADVVWLCKPGTEPDPCRGSLDTTVYSTAGDSHTESPKLPPNPPVDCFYVYPTVSEQPSTNSDKTVDPQQTAIAQYQAARFSQLCKVYAPMYRQQTLLALTAGGSADALKLAYGDVLEAWRDYLKHYNRGRGFILLGHSQGSRMLRQLIRKEIDPAPQIRDRLISAVIPGANVTVKQGQLYGGDFQNVPGCVSASQIGCVMAWSTFNQTPPSNSRFGRVPDSDTSGFGLPAGPGYEVLCSNPASLSENQRAPLQTLLRSEPFPGVIGALLIEMYSGPPPSAPTPWLEPQDHYTAQCETRDGANVLELEPVGDARTLNPSPDPSWGLHLADMNLPLGNLIDVVHQQVAAYRASVPPRLRLRLRYRHGRLSGGRRCAHAPIRASVGGKDSPKVIVVEFRLRGKLTKRDRHPPFRARIGSARLRPGRRNKIRASAVLKDGRTAHFSRSLPVCP
jgi:hypothetical protein